MITKEVFTDTIRVYKNGFEFLKKMYDEGLDLYETPLTISTDTLFDAWLNQVTNEEGQDLIYWWLFEDVDKVIYEDGKNNINVEELKDLYTYMQSSNMFIE